jgi:hypothetical protein
MSAYERLTRIAEVAIVGWVVERPVRCGKMRFTAAYRDDHGRIRSAGTYNNEREAQHAAVRQDDKVTDGTWVDRAAGQITFREYAQDVWLPSRHLEVTTRAGYQSYLRIHFVPFFATMRLAQIRPSNVQEWVSLAAERGLSPQVDHQIPHDAALVVRPGGA